MARSHALGDGFVEGHHSEETAHKGVASSVGVNQHLLGERVHSVRGALALGCDDGGLVSLGEHHHTGARAGSLRLCSELQSDGLQVLSVALGVSVGLRLRLVGKDVVGVSMSVCVNVGEVRGLMCVCARE